MKYGPYALGMLAVFASFMGFVIENVWLALTKGYIDNRNMNLPFLLGYGLAIVAFYLILGTPYEMTALFFFWADMPRWAPSVLYFFCAALFVSMGELALGFATEKLCHIEYWNYSRIPLHITKYTAVPTSLGFAAMITIFMDRFFNPLMGAIQTLDKRFLRIAAPLLIAALTADYLYCYGRMMKTRSLYDRWRVQVSKALSGRYLNGPETTR